MKLIQEGALISEIIFQADLVLHANDRLKKSLDEFDHTATWSAIQSILISSNNIVKILWPTKRKYTQRGKELRALLNVTSSCVLKSKSFRNKFEHYDEIISDFFEDKNVYAYTDFVMNPSLQTFGMESCHRGFDTDTSTLFLHGESLELNPIINASRELKNKCTGLFL